MKIDCFIKINDYPQMPFQIDHLCNSRRIRQYLNQTMGLHQSPYFTEIFLNDKKILDESTPLLQLGTKKNDIITVKSISVLVDQTKKDIFFQNANLSPKFVADKCKGCQRSFKSFNQKDALFFPIFIPCNHVVFCSSNCMKTSGSCPICRTKSIESN